ncbi:hypothetical protein ACG7TL_007198 [Trametes sanguinea]
MSTSVLVSTFSPFPTLALSVPAETSFADLYELLAERYPTLPLHSQAADLVLSPTSGALPEPSTPLSSLLDDDVDEHSLVSLRLVPRLRGGKGGFGSQLRAAGGRMSSQKTSNNDSCRDLSGRRLSTIKEAKKLAEYIETEPLRKKAQQEAQRAKLEALEKKLGMGPDGSIDPLAGKKRRLEDTEYIEQSKDIVENVKSAVSVAMLKKKKKAKKNPSPPAEASSSGAVATTVAAASAAAEKVLETATAMKDQVLESSPVAAAAAAAPGKKRRLDDTEYIEQSKDIVKNVKSAVAVAMLQKNDQVAATVAAASVAAEKVLETATTLKDRVVESSPVEPIAAAATAVANASAPSLLTLGSVSLLVGLVTTALAQIVGPHNSSLSFKVNSGGNDNYFLRDNTTSAQLLLTSANSTSAARRLVVALPAGNSGALTYFLPKDADAGTNTNATLNVTLVEGSVRSATADYFNVGVQADLRFDRNATLGVTIIGAVRAMRDYVEGNGVMHEIFNYTLASYNDTSLRLHRRWINTTSPTSSAYNGADLYLTVPAGSAARLAVTPGNNGTWTPPTVDVLVPAAGGTVRVAVVTNETSLVGLGTERLFLPESTNRSRALQTALQGLADGQSDAAQQVSFLTYENKFTAGGWRFLTYFGRDSMIALRLLMPTLTSEAIEAALGAVIERANSTGALCHEETIGTYCPLSLTYVRSLLIMGVSEITLHSSVNMQNDRSDLGNQPFYDYKMIDTDLLLLPAMSHYFLELPQGSDRAAQFLARNATLQNGTYAEILNRTIHYNLARAMPFARSPTPSRLIGLRPGEPVGNWRDSNEGLGYGLYPFDVNSALVPASLRATEALLRAGVLGSGFGGLDAGEVAEVAEVWEREAPGMFEVRVGRGVAEERLRRFVRRANLSEALLKSTNSSAGAQEADVSFYALSLKEDGTPVEVLNSDMGFNLVYGANVSRAFLEHVVDALQPYPRGLLTDVGIVVANPAYDSNATMIDVLNRAAYHGTVIWSFQQGLMAAGLARQLALCPSNNSTDASNVDTYPTPARPPSWCADAPFVQSLRAAQSRLWTAIRGAQSEIYTEVWSYAFDNATGTFGVADLASLSPTGTESDAIQLWSYGFLGLLDPATGGNGTRAV